MDFLGSGASPPLQSYGRSGFQISAFGMSCLRALASMLDAINPEPPAFTRSFAQSGVMLPALDFSHLGSITLLRSYPCPGFVAPLSGLACLGSVFSPSAMELTYSGSLPTTQSLSHIDFTLAAIDSLHLESLLLSRSFT
jgi:hypothetical protein